MKYHKLKLDGGEVFAMVDVADCFVNPLNKDLKDCLRELCWGRPAWVQQILWEASDIIEQTEKNPMEVENKTPTIENTTVEEKLKEVEGRIHPTEVLEELVWQKMIDVVNSIGFHTIDTDLLKELRETARFIYEVHNGR